MRRPTGRRRLSAATLGEAHADLVPTYDRHAPATIVHLGVGAFARAHLGVYADDLLRSGRPATIAGVSLRSPTAEEQLGPQDGLFTVVEREPGRPRRPAGRRLVRLGGHRPGRRGRGHRRPDDPPGDADRDGEGLRARAGAGARRTEARHARPRPSSPAGWPAAIGRLRHRRSPRSTTSSATAGGSASGSSRKPSDLDPALARWIERHGRVPLLGGRPDGAGHHRGRPRRHRRRAGSRRPRRRRGRAPPLLDRRGRGRAARRSPTSASSWWATSRPYERRKLWLLNGPHSTLAYLGLLAGHETIADAAGDPTIAAFARRLVDDVLEVADLPAGLAPEAFAGRRAAPVREPGPRAHVRPGRHRRLSQARRAHPPGRRPADVGPACPPTGSRSSSPPGWPRSPSVPVQGRRLPAVDDPEAEPLRRLAADGDLHALAARALGDVGDPDLVADVAATLASPHRARRRRDRRTLTGSRHEKAPLRRAGPSGMTSCDGTRW